MKKEKKAFCLKEKLAPRNVRLNIILGAIILGGLLLDQITKILVVSFMDVGDSISIIPKLLNITYIENKGMAFGLLSNARWVFLVVSTIAIALIAVYLFLFSKERALFKVGLAMIISGGIGNMIDRTFRGDRIFDGAVVDMIDFRGIWDYVFNVADSFVCVGAGIVILSLVLDLVKEFKEKKKDDSKSA